MILHLAQGWHKLFEHMTKKKFKKSFFVPERRSGQQFSGHRGLVKEVYLEYFWDNFLMCSIKVYVVGTH